MKKFKEVFPNFDSNGKLDDIIKIIDVEKISTTPDMSILRIYIHSERLIEKEIIYELERLIKSSLFSAKKIDIKILEKFKLSGQYTTKNLYEAYRDSILLELKNYSMSQYMILSKREPEFIGNNIMEISIENNSLNLRVADELIHIMDKIFNDRCGISSVIRYKLIDYIPKVKNDNFAKPEIVTPRQINQKLMTAGGTPLPWEEDTVSMKEKVQEKKAPATNDISKAEIPSEKKTFSPKQKYGYQKKSNSPDVFYGRDFEDAFIPLKDIIDEIGEVTVKGQICELDSRYFENRGSTLFVFAITDFTDSINVKLFANEENVEELKENLKVGKSIKVRGIVKTDPFDRELTISSIRGMKRSEHAGQSMRTDTAEVKRVELHMHTKMSDFDGVSSAEDIIKQASKWGMDAIAITDHGNVQAFTEASHVKIKDGIMPKIIYGVEAYLVDDINGMVVNPNHAGLDSTFVVFDIETTGLSAKKDRIIEFGAVKIQNGKIIDTFSGFVNPGIPIPFKIEELTGINDNMVIDAPDIRTVLPSFLEFSRDCIAVAHNASFDTGFIKAKAKELGLTYNPPIIDTVALARFLMPELKNHKLDTVSKALNINLENHHRAVDDAKATAFIFLAFIDMLTDKGIRTLEDLVREGRSSDNMIRKMRANHVILLAKNDIGRINLYRLVSYSHIQYFNRTPKIPKSVLNAYREGLIVGSACEAGELYSAILDGKSDEDIKRIAEFYDYLEIQPIANNQFLIEEERYSIHSKEDLQDINRMIVKLGKEMDKPVVATCDAHFINPEDEIYRRILMHSKKFKDADNQPPLYLRTTDEMLDEFSYLGSDIAYEVVVTNTRKIADMVERISPVRPDKCPPVIENSDEELRSSCYEKAYAQYGNPLPKIVQDRLEKELNSIINNGFAVMYIIAKKLVEKSNEDGYLVGSRGSVGSSFAAYASGITEVNPMPPHYYCDCKYVEFDTPEVRAFSGMAGCDMPDKLCPNCGKLLKKDGYDIPFETFLGFKGDKEPDIDLNFSGEYQANAHDYTEVLFGEGHTFRAGTVGTVADKTAYGYVKAYYEDHEQVKRKAEINRISKGCVGVRRTTGQHPGGIIVLPHGEEIYSFTPVQRPANDMTTKTITTHFDYHAIDHNLLKLDILGHQDPTMIRMLQDLTGIDPVKDIPLDSKETMSLFKNTSALGIEPRDILDCPLGALGVPEFGTDFAMQMLIDAKPEGFSDLVRIAGLAHGTDVWLGNAKTLIEEGKATIRTAICTRDDIMIYLIDKGLAESNAFNIMESVRKGKGLTPENEEDMRAAGVPEWYIWSCKKIKYMFPKAHAAAYVMMAWRVAYCKIFYPLAYYTSYFTIRASGFSYELMCFGKERAEYHIKEIKAKGDSAAAKDADVLRDLRIVQEMYARGFEFAPIDLYQVDAIKFQITKDQRIMPALSSIDGLGEVAAKQIVNAARQGEFISKEDLSARAKIGPSTCDLLERLGLLGNLPQSNQISIFDLL